MALSLQTDLLPRPRPRKFRLKPPAEPERYLHKPVTKLLDAILLEPAMWACYPAGAAALSPQQQARYSEVGLNRGWPDLLILHGGYLYGIELKSRDGVLSRTRIGRTKRGAPRILEGQVDVFPKLLAAGFRAIEIARSVDDVIRWLDVWAVPHREVF